MAASLNYPTLSTSGSFTYDTVTYPSTTTLPGMAPQTPPLSRCAKDGHDMADEAEYADGSIVGTCEVCGEQIFGRRMVGGLGTLLLRTVMMELLAGDGDMDELKEAILNIETLLQMEEHQLREARALLDTAKAMMVRPRRESVAA